MISILRSSDYELEYDSAKAEIHKQFIQLPYSDF